MDAENSQFCVNIYCVMPKQATEATCPRDLFMAYECCKDNGFNVVWIQEEEGFKLKPCKEDVFILSEFTGPLFDFLRRFKCTIIGPQCLLVCVQKGEPLPEVPTPVFTVAMKGLVVTSTGCSPQEKKEIQEKVQFMGGLYSSAFLGNVTHLIVKSVADFSLKFKVAIEKDIPVMVPKWVDAVWTTSMKESVHGTDPAFAKYACPPFLGLNVCVSQIPNKEREALKKIIEANGGQYSGNLEKGKTNILISASAEGDKFTYARHWRIRCLKPEWIHASLNKGYAVDPENYLVKASNMPPRCSTPEADHSVMKFGNGTMNSTILNESRIQQVDETVGSTTTMMQDQKPDCKSLEALDSLDLAVSKKAGPFLDGCKVYLSGFDGNQMEKLRRIVNNAGVARFNNISESLSHVIAGQRVDEDWKQLQQLIHKPHVVTVEWVVQSLRMKRAAPEAAYLHPDFKTLVAPVNNKENVVKKVVPAEPVNDPHKEDSQMVQQYLTTDNFEEDETLAQRRNGFFSGLTFRLVGLDTDSVLTVNDMIASQGGRVVVKKANYVVTEPVSPSSSVDIELQGDEIFVSTMWIEDCVEEDRLVDIEIHHRPIKVNDNRRLSGCVVSFSGLQGRLRELLDHLIGYLGGRPQETFSRKLMEEKNVYKSTHLVCARPEGKKYEKALEWGVPVVNAEWVIACANSKERPDEKDFPPGSDNLKAAESDLVSVSSKQSEPTTQSVVIKSAKHMTPKLDTPISYPAARQLPHHFDISTPQTPLLTTTTPAGLRLRPALSDTPTTLSGLGSNKLSRATDSPQPRAALFNMPTPETPYGRLLNTDPSPDTRKMWKHALDNRVRLTPRLDDHGRRSSEQAADREVVMDPETDGYFENLRKKLRLDNGVGRPVISHPENEPTTSGVRRSPTPKRPFDGVVAFIHKKIEDQRSELARAVEALGGRVRYQHCEEVTHFVYQGKLAASKEVRSAKEWHQKFVSPQWILDCEDASIRLEESQYPPSLNPKMTLSLNFNSQPIPPASSQKRRNPATSCMNTPKTLARKSPSPGPETPRQLDAVQEKELNQDRSQLASEMEEEACKELMQLDQVLSRTAEQVPLNKVANVSAARNGRASDHLYVPPTQPIDSVPDSQSVPITWDLHETQKHVNTQPTPVYRIMFSGMAQADRDSCTTIIEKLGGTVLETSHYDPTCTHLVVAKVGCNEKLLTSIAAGKWVMHPEWLSESEKEKRFLEEVKFEWGNPESIVVHPPSDPISEDEAHIAAAAHYWRLDRTRGLSEGPFSGIKAVLHLREKNASFQRLLEAGGGEIIDSNSALENTKANLCIVDHREVKKIKLPVYAARGIYCVPVIYLRNVVLATNKKLKWSEAVVPEFMPYLEKMPC